MIGEAWLASKPRSCKQNDQSVNMRFNERAEKATLRSYGFVSVASLKESFCINSGDHSASFALPLTFISVAA